MTPRHRHGLAERGRRLLLREYWNIGVVDQTAADIAEKGIARPVRWLPPPAAGTMLADPSCFTGPGGHRTLFAEYLDHRSPRGEIWSAELAPGEDATLARFAPLLSGAHHMSYPQPCMQDSRRFLICESWQSGGIPLWENVAGRWSEREPLLRGRQPVDPTLFEWQGHWWLFCTFHDDDPDARLHIFHALSLTGPFVAHTMNPIRHDPSAARPAGPIFMAGDVPVRPAQDCSRTYGGAIVLNAIIRLTPDSYHERPIRRITPPAAGYPHGLHTICPAGELTLIDGKRWGFDPRPLSQQVVTKTRKLLRRAVGHFG